MNVFVRVVFPLPLGQSFVYGVPERLRVRARPGCRVLAPLGKKDQTGFVIAAGAGPPPEGIRVKEIVEVLDEKPLWDEAYLSFTGALSAESHTSWGEILQASLPPSLAQKVKVTVTLTDPGRAALAGKRLGPKESALAALLENQPAGRGPLFLQRKAGLKNASTLISRMEKKGLVSVRKSPVRPPGAGMERRADGASQLNLDFDLARQPKGPLAPVDMAIDEGRFGAYYLFGSRGALDAAYRDLLRRASASPGKTLVLVPEVALTREFIAGFETQFGRTAAVFHGRMTEKQKETAWRGLASGKTALAAGTRSALFLSLRPLRLIIVGDEHEESYVQSESPSYDARRGAWLRARSENAVVVFGSPRPSVEAFYQALREGALIDLGAPAEKARVAWIDHRTEAPVLSRDLERRIRDSLRRDEPVILFLNRRGYAASLVCAACGRIPRCRRCDIPLVYHKKEDELICHYCNASLRAGAGCPSCGGRLTLLRGAGTQALEEEIKRILPGVPVGRFDTDTAPGREEREKIVRGFSRGRIPVLIGTQLLAHQPGVPRVRLVGILAPETLLAFSDYRASQRTFQAVSRMTDFCETAAGSEVVIQTPAPVHYSIQAAAARDFRLFYDREIDFRRVMNYPPLAALAEVTLEGRDIRSLAGRAREFRALLRKFEPELEVLGPALASVVRVRDMARVQVVLKALQRDTIDRALDETLPHVRLKKAVVFSYSPFG
jgi:primosomal protein N' (replication factor Y)